MTGDLIFYDHRQHGMNVLMCGGDEGKNLWIYGTGLVVARARRTGTGSWLLKIYHGCWTDPRARTPSRVTGKVDASYLEVATRREARKILLQLAQNVHGDLKGRTYSDLKGRMPCHV